MSTMAARANPSRSRWTFTCYGVPIPKGSTKAIIPRGWARAIVTADNAKTKPWQAAIAISAQAAGRRAQLSLDGPVALTLRFYLPKPKTAPRHRVDHLKKPDLDKLARACCDGLTHAGVYRDDSQVVAMVVSKQFAAGVYDPEGASGVPRVEVIVGACELPATEARP